MMTLQQIASGRIATAVPMHVTWYLSELGEAKGRQDLFIRQSPQRLQVLRDRAMVESAVSSNRIEGVEIEPARIGTVIFGRTASRDRNEEEIRGYRDALNLIHTEGARAPVSEATILRLHRLVRGGMWDAGRYKDKPVDIIENAPDGHQRVRFRSVPPERTPEYIQQMIRLWDDEHREHRVSPLITVAAMNLDFLCIHPFRDGNGRVSRLLLLLSCYHIGVEVGRYISLERLIEDTKERYYETLEHSSQRWHEGRHDPWPYIQYVLFILRSAYEEFARRIGEIASPRGAKTEMILSVVNGQTGAFRIRDIQRQCPGVSVDMIRRVLKNMRRDGRVRCLGRGQNAQWEHTPGMNE